MRRMFNRDSLPARVSLVLFAFILMVVSSCVIMSRTLNNKLLQHADEVITSTQAYISHLLLEPEAVINLMADTIQDQIRSRESFEAIQKHMDGYSSPEYMEKMRMFEYISVFGYFDVYDAFYDGGGWKPTEDYLPRERPWYIAAIQSDSVGISSPYIDMDTGEPVISFARSLLGHGGELFGVISIDVPIGYIKQILVQNYITEGSYGVLIDETLHTIIHPDDARIGEYILESNIGFAKFSDMIAQGMDLSQQRVINYQGENSLLFGRRIDNGWYLGMVVSEAEYYKDLYQMILIISVMGSVMAAALLLMMVRLDAARKKADEENRLKSAQLAEVEKARAADEYVQLMLDATPLGFNLWTRDVRNIATNEEAARMFHVSSKSEYLERFHELSPPIQPCGTPSMEKAGHYVTKAYDEGYCRFEWMHQTITGEPMPSEVTMVRVKQRDEYIVVGYIRDLREHKQMLGEIDRRTSLLQTVNRAAGIILATTDDDKFVESLLAGFRLIGQSMDVDRVQIWENEVIDGQLHFVHKYEWLSRTGMQKTPVPIGLHFPYSSVPGWHKLFLDGGYLNAPLSSLNPNEQEFLRAYDMQSIVIIPLFLQEQFWGFFSVDDCRNQRAFNKDEIDIMRSASLMMASAVNRHEQNAEIREADEYTQLMLDATPFSCSLWADPNTVITCNQETVNLFKLENRNDFIEGFYTQSPEYQPCGGLSSELIAANNQKAFDEGYNRLEWIHRTHDGELFPAEVTLVRIRHKGKHVIAAYIRDLREYKKAEEALRSAQQTTAAMFENNPRMNLLLDSAFRIIDCNPAAMQMWGFTAKEELLEGFFDKMSQGIPVFQSDGKPSLSIFDRLAAAARKGEDRFELELFIGGDMRIHNVELRRIPYEGSYAIVAYVNDMTEVRAREKEIKTALEESKAILDNMDSMIVVSDFDHKLLFANKLLADTYNFDRELSIGKKCHEVIRGYSEPCASCHMDDLIPNKDTFPSIDYEYVWDDTVGKWINGTDSIIRWVDGSTVYFQSMRDATQKKQAEEELIRSHKTNELQLSKLNLAAKATKIGMWDMEFKNGVPLGPQSEITYSSEVRQMLGFASEADFPNVMGSLSSRLHHDDTDRVCDSLTMHLMDKSGNTPYDMEFQMLTKSGEYRHFHDSGDTIRDEEGNALRTVGALMDITDTKKTLLERELQITKLNMAISATKIALWDMDIVHSNPVGADNKLVWSNEFRRLFGYTDDNDFPNTLSSWSDCLHPDDKQRVLDAFAKHMLDWTGKTPYDIEYRVIKKNGELAYHHCTGTTTRDESGKPLRVVGTQMDITESKNVLLETERLRIEAEAANHAKSDFLSSMSHEIRTPMNAIIGMSDLLALEQLNDRQSHYVMDISTSAHSLLSIINNILDLSKIESGKLTLDRVDYDFHALLDNIKSMFRFVAEKKGIEFILVEEGDIPAYLHGDDVRLRQILTNICGNAIKFTEKGYVMLKVFSDTGTLYFEIRDTGMGIRRDFIPRLFDEYEQADEYKNRSVTGTGLGLTISKAFIEMMNGSIIVDSEYGKGTVFTLAIPFTYGDKDKVKHDDSNVMRSLSVCAPDARILVVDDNDVNLRVATGLLSLYEITPNTALSGQEALRLVQENEYDIVFMDHMMPEMDGIEATAAIRELGGRYESLPIIALTANAIHGAKEMFIANGLDGFLTKPIITRALHDTLMEWLPSEIIMEKLIDADEGAVNGSDDSPAGFMDGLAQIPEINVEAGLLNFTGVVSSYKETFELFYRKIIKECDSMTAFLETRDTHNFTILIHGMKSSLAIIGAVELSGTAARMEAASKKDEIDYCFEAFPVFRKQLILLHERLSALFRGEPATAKKQGNQVYLSETVQKAIEAADDFDYDACIEAIDDLLSYDFGKEINDSLGGVLAALNDFKIGEAADILKRLT